MLKGGQRMPSDQRQLFNANGSDSYQFLSGTSPHPPSMDGFSSNSLIKGKDKKKK